MDLSKEVPFGSLERLLTRWKRERIRISPTTGVSSRTTSKCARARAIVEPFLAKNRSKAQTMLICKRAVHTDCLGLQTTDPHHQSFFFCTRRLVYITVSFKLPNETRRMGFIVRDKKMLSKCYCIFSRDTFEKKNRK